MHDHRQSSTTRVPYVRTRVPVRTCSLASELRAAPQQATNYARLTWLGDCTWQSPQHVHTYYVLLTCNTGDFFVIIDHYRTSMKLLDASPTALSTNIHSGGYTCQNIARSRDVMSYFDWTRSNGKKTRKISGCCLKPVNKLFRQLTSLPVRSVWSWRFLFVNWSNIHRVVIYWLLVHTTLLLWQAFDSARAAYRRRLLTSCTVSRRHELYSHKYDDVRVLLSRLRQPKWGYWLLPVLNVFTNYSRLWCAGTIPRYSYENMKQQKNENFVMFWLL